MRGVQASSSRLLLGTISLRRAPDPSGCYICDIGAVDETADMSARRMASGVGVSWVMRGAER